MVLCTNGSKILKYSFLAGLILLFLGGCAPKITPTKTTPVFLLLKTKTLKFADTGFVKKSNEGYYIELFSAGNLLFWLYIEPTKICVKEGCKSSDSFVKEELSPFYPPDILYNIVAKEAIFSSQGIVKNEFGFEQKISLEGKFDIDYEVGQGESSFKDRLNKINIVIRELKNMN